MFNIQLRIGVQKTMVPSTMAAVVVAATYVVRATRRHVIHVLWRRVSHNETIMSRNGESDCRKQCFGPFAVRPLPIANTSVVLIVRGWRLSLLPILLLRSSFLKNMRNEAIEVLIDFVGQNASQRCKVGLNGPKERND
jgi:hypothetical protein